MLKIIERIWRGHKIDTMTFDLSQGLKLRVHTKKMFFLISQPKHMLWVLKRKFSMRRFFRAPKTYVKTDG